MKEKIISITYDGPSTAIKNHQIDARLLASVLDNFADLITSADEAIHKRHSPVQVKAQAGFIRGSFGIELLVNADMEVLKAIGLVAFGACGSALSILKTIKSKKVDSVEIDETAGTATITTSDGVITETSSAVACLLDSSVIRNRIDKLIHQPLSKEGINKFSVYTGSLDGLDENQLDNLQPTVVVTDESSVYFKKPSATQTLTHTSIESKAVIEFVAANKESGKSGWRMNYLAYQNTAVKILDEEFLEKIQLLSAPRIFASKFNVELRTTVTTKQQETVNQTFHIVKVIGPHKP